MREFFRGILSSFEEERENHFVGRLPGVALTLFDDPGLLSFAPKGLAEKQPSEVTRSGRAGLSLEPRAADAAITEHCSHRHRRHFVFDPFFQSEESVGAMLIVGL